MKKENRKSPVLQLVYSAVCLSLCLVLPFLTGQIPQLGNALCPMHFPVLIAGFICGPWWAAAVGLVAPLLRHTIFGMPPLLTAVAMAAELATYGLVSGFLYEKLPKKVCNIYLSLISAMICGRILWGIVRVFLAGVSGEVFTWAIFMSGAIITAIPGIILQLILIPVIVIALKKSRFL